MMEHEYDLSSERNIAEEYEQMCVQNKEQAVQLEVLKQEVHSLKRRNEVVEKTNADYQSELDHQEQKMEELKKSHSAFILKLKEDNAVNTKELVHKLHSLEEELKEIQNSYAHDREEFIKTRNELNDLHKTSPIATLKAELQEAMEEHAASRVACVQHQELNAILLKEKAEILDELHCTKQILETMEEKLKICKANSFELSETLEDLKGSYALVQSELACLKAAPLEDVGRGNSLFAEVEDKRQSMLKQCTTMKDKYKEMKKDYGAKCAKISKLKLENLQLRRTWQEELEERDNRDVWLADNYEIRIKELLKALEDEKQKEKPIFLQGDSKIMAYVEPLVDNARKEKARLQDEMELRSSERLTEAKALYLARKEVQSLKTQLMSLHAENLVLRDKLDSANITDIPSPAKTQKCLKEVLQNGKGIDQFKLTMGSLKDRNVPKSTKGIPSSQIDAPGSCQTEQSDTSDHLRPSCISSFKSNVPMSSRVIGEEMVGAVLRESEDILPSQNYSLGSCLTEEILPRDTSSPPNEPFISSFVSNVPKPARVLKVEMMEKLKVESAAALFSLSNNEHVCKSPTLTSTDVVIDPEEQTFSPQLKVTEGTPIFISPSMIKPISVPKAVRENKACGSGEMRNESGFTASIDVDSNTDKNLSVTEKLSKSSEDSLLEVKEASEPGRSILSRASRPSLVPMDQNLLARKVRFDPSSCEVIEAKCPRNEDGAETTSKAAKRKLGKLPTSQFKTRIIISKETVLENSD